MNEKIMKKIEEVIGELAQEFMRQDIPDDITKTFGGIVGTFFLQGVEWQTENACEYLRDNLDRYDENIGWTKEEFINNFKKEMEAEK